MWLSPWTRRLAVLVALAILLPLWHLADGAIEQMRVAALRARAQEGYYLPPRGLLRALSFGYNELGADLLWVRTIAYFADHLTTDQDLRYLQRYVSSILALDRHSKHVYRYGASMLMSRGARQTNADVLLAIDLLRRGHELWPDEWRFPLSIGGYYINELRSPSRAERERWRRLGADWVHRAALIGAEIPWLPSLAANIYSQQGRQDLAILHLQELYLATANEQMKQQIAAKLRRLQSAKQAHQLRAAAVDFQRAHRESGLSYVPPDLFVLLRLQPLAPFSWREAPP